MENKNVSPKIHLFTKLNKLRDNQLVMITLPTGEKYKLDVAGLKEFINADVVKELNKIKEQIKDVKVTKASIIDAFKRSSSISFGKPLNMLSDVGIEKLKPKGVIYSDGKRVRAYLNGKWHTLKIDDGK